MYYIIISMEVFIHKRLFIKEKGIHPLSKGKYPFGVTEFYFFFGLFIAGWRPIKIETTLLVCELAHTSFYFFPLRQGMFILVKESLDFSSFPVITVKIRK